MIGYYVHHQGTGHGQRARAVASKLQIPVTGLSSGAMPAGWPGSWVRLAEDAPVPVEETADVTARSTFHWLPRHHDGLRERMGAISAVLTGGAARLLVCDVSVEVTVLARLHGVPVVVMAQPGDRTDRAHRLAYDLADRLLAPWPAHPARPWPASWAAKTVHLGGLSRYDGRVPVPEEDDATGDRRVLVVWGSGGIDVSRESLHAAARSTPEWTWQVVGPGTGPCVSEPPANVHDLGWVPDIWPLLCRATVVVTHAGQNAVAEVAAARRPAIVIPQGRPFAEQDATAEALAELGVATVARAWPAPADWRPLLRRVARRDGDAWAGWSTGDAAVRAAEEIEAMAAAGRP